MQTVKIDREVIKGLLDVVLNEVDYDIWKDYFINAESEADLEELTDLVWSYLTED